MIPTLFNFPLWINTKRRIAKKHFRQWGREWMLNGKYADVTEPLACLKVGDFVNTCTGFNHRITKVHPVYRSVGRHGQALFDVDLDADGGSCSFAHCGVCIKTREEVEEWYVQHLKRWTLGEYGKLWLGEGSETYQKEVERANKIISVFESGNHFTTEHGEPLLEFQR
jgi:hypothetical protein